MVAKTLVLVRDRLGWSQRYSGDSEQGASDYACALKDDFTRLQRYGTRVMVVKVLEEYDIEEKL